MTCDRNCDCVGECKAGLDTPTTPAQADREAANVLAVIRGGGWLAADKDAALVRAIDALNERALRSPEARSAGEAVAWSDGEPPTWFDESFIALLDDGERVVLRRLPEEWAYDYTTADGTYYKAFRLKRWMQFPDSQYKSQASPAPPAPAEQGAREVVARLHRGSLADSMETVARVPANEPALRDFFGSSGALTVKPYGWDPRIGWDTYIVTDSEGVVGFLNGPLAATRTTGDES